MDSRDAHVAILLASHNGERFIGGQLASIGAQTHRSWELWVSDDGSSDSTLEKVRLFANQGREDRVHVIAGPGRGFVANFLSLACNPGIKADYFAFCDQDDVWLEEKLETAVKALSQLAPGQPGAYFGRTQIVDAENRPTGFSPLFSRKPALENALVQSIGGGNTMVINAAARNILCVAGHDLDVASHDWWTYLAVCACAGVAIYDDKPLVRYRQHGQNVIGENSSALARLFRVRLLLSGRFSAWIDANLTGLERLDAVIPAHNRAIISDFRALRREKRAFSRLIGLHRQGLYRQTFPGTLSLYAAALLGKW